MTDGGTETLCYCEECGAVAMIEVVEDSDL